jgi:hypothetical protein
MALKTENAKIVIRNDLSNNWTTVDPILGLGELGIERTNNGQIRIKTGNGIDRFSTLPYTVDEGTIYETISLLKDNTNSSIESEITNRVNADNANSDRIENETARAQEQEETLQGNIDTLESDFTENLETLRDNFNTALETEIENREDQINQEIVERAIEISGVQNQLYLEIENRTNDVSGLVDQINQEIVERAIEISGVQNQLHLEIENRTNDVSGLVDQISGEINDRILEVSGVQNQLYLEIDDRESDSYELQSGINDLSGLINQETYDRISSNTILQGNIDEKISIEKLPYSLSDIEISSNNSSVSIEKTRINTSTGNETSTSDQIPIATTEKVGLMSNSDVQQIQTLTAEINSLKGIKKNFVVTMDSDTPTQEELLAAFQTVSELEIPSDGVTLWDQSYDKEYIFFESDGLFHDRGNSTIALATNNSPGVVQGNENSPGKIYVENDGSMSLNGYDSLNSSISGLETNKLNVDFIVNNLTSTDTNKPLSANQGKVLKDLITTSKYVANNEEAAQSYSTSNPAIVVFYPEE